MRNMLLEAGEKVIFLTKWQRTWLNYVPVFCGRQNFVSDCYRTNPGEGVWTINYYGMDPPLCSGDSPPHTTFALLAARERRLSMPEIGEKERDFLFKELYKLKSNNLMSSLRSQSPLEYPQMHSPFLPPLPSPGSRVSEKEIEVRGSSLPKSHGPQKTPNGCCAWV